MNVCFCVHMCAHSIWRINVQNCSLNLRIVAWLANEVHFILNVIAYIDDLYVQKYSDTV